MELKKYPRNIKVNHRRHHYHHHEDETLPDHFDDEDGDEYGCEHADEDHHVLQHRQVRHERWDAGSHGGALGHVARQSILGDGRGGGVDVRGGRVVNLRFTAADAP